MTAVQSVRSLLAWQEVSCAMLGRLDSLWETTDDLGARKKLTNLCLSRVTWTFKSRGGSDSARVEIRIFRTRTRIWLGIRGQSGTTKSFVVCHLLIFAPHLILIILPSDLNNGSFSRSICFPITTVFLLWSRWKIRVEGSMLHSTQELSPWGWLNLPTCNRQCQPLFAAEVHRAHFTAESSKWPL